MKIIEPSVELVDYIDGDEVLKKIESCGRVCYQSEPKGKPAEFVRRLIKRGHDSCNPQREIARDSRRYIKERRRDY